MPASRAPCPTRRLALGVPDALRPSRARTWRPTPAGPDAMPVRWPELLAERGTPSLPAQLVHQPGGLLEASFRQRMSLPLRSSPPLPHVPPADGAAGEDWIGAHFCPLEEGLIYVFSRSLVQGTGLPAPAPGQGPPRLRIRHRLARRDAALDSGKPKAQAALKLFQRRLASRH